MSMVIGVMGKGHLCAYDYSSKRFWGINLNLFMNFGHWDGNNDNVRAFHFSYNNHDDDRSWRKRATV